MPIGYTAKLMESGVDFRTFVLTCARGMGACIMQRDDPMDEPPKKQEASEYQTNALNTAKELLEKLRAMDAIDRKEYGEKLRAAEIDGATKYLMRAREENARLDAMVEQVRAWNPPTPEHNGLKDFMLQQMEISRNDTSYSEARVPEAKKKGAYAYFLDDLKRALHDVNYHQEQIDEEAGRYKERNEWIDKLYSSLPA